MVYAKGVIISRLGYREHLWDIDGKKVQKRVINLYSL